MPKPDRIIAQRELRNNVSQVLRDVAEGKSFRVTVNGQAVADLIPIRAVPQGAPREVLERILRLAPLDADFARDVDAVLGEEPAYEDPWQKHERLVRERGEDPSA